MLRGAPPSNHLHSPTFTYIRPTAARAAWLARPCAVDGPSPGHASTNVNIRKHAPTCGANRGNRSRAHARVPSGDSTGGDADKSRHLSTFGTVSAFVGFCRLFVGFHRLLRGPGVGFCGLPWLSRIAAVRSIACAGTARPRACRRAGAQRRRPQPRVRDRDTHVQTAAFDTPMSAPPARPKEGHGRRSSTKQERCQEPAQPGPLIFPRPRDRPSTLVAWQSSQAFLASSPS